MEENTKRLYLDINGCPIEGNLLTSHTVVYWDYITRTNHALKILSVWIQNFEYVDEHANYVKNFRITYRCFDMY